VEELETGTSRGQVIESSHPTSDNNGMLAAQMHGTITFQLMLTKACLATDKEWLGLRSQI
jgi:hypothetical protein